MGGSEARYAHLDHTADLGIAAEAPGECELYEICARALFDILRGESCSAEPSRSVEIHVRQPERDLLLAAWLKELLYLHERDRWIFTAFQVTTGRDPDGGRWLKGIASGETFVPGRHVLETEVKAVTYHQLSVCRDRNGRWRARVIFDI